MEDSDRPIIIQIMRGSVELSVVIPIYNSAEIFPVLYKRLVDTLTAAVASYEIIAVVDGCTDDSAEVIANICRRDNKLKLLEFSRNFGHQAAVTAGLQYASGSMAVVMDDDLEDPPEVLPAFIAKAQQGYDVVYGIRRKRKVSLFRRLSCHLFYRLLNRLVDIDVPPDAGDFCLMTRPVVETLCSMPETNRYNRGLRAWAGFRQTGVEYERQSRLAGESGYGLTQYMGLAIDGILSFSYKPLVYVSLIGFSIASLSFLYGMALVLAKFSDKVRDVPGWASTMIVILFVGGIQLLSLGIIGQYIARIYDEVKQRPKFIIKGQIGFPRDDLNEQNERGS